MDVRLFSMDDYEAVYRLWRGTPGMGLNDIDDSRDGIARYLKRNPNTCFVCVDGDAILGVILSGHDGRRGFISHTCVAQPARRQGVGTRLVAAAMDALRAEGITKVGLFVFERNEHGNAFWESQGFALRTDLNYRNKALVHLTRMDT